MTEFYRVDLTAEEIENLIFAIRQCADDSKEYDKTEVMKKLQNARHIVVSNKKLKHCSTMVNKRWKGTKERVYAVIERLRKENIGVIPSIVAKKADVHYQTAKKYIEEYSKEFPA